MITRCTLRDIDIFPLRYPNEPKQPDGYLHEEDRRLVMDGVIAWYASDEAQTLAKEKPQSFAAVEEKVCKALWGTNHGPQWSEWRKIYAAEGGLALVQALAMTGPAKI